MSFERVQMGKDLIFEINVRDQDGRVMEKWKVMKNDFPNVVRILNGKFGLNMRIKIKKDERELDWAL